MPTYTLEKTFETAVCDSPNVRLLGEFFGLDTQRPRRVTVLEPKHITVNPGDVVFITGSSGGGKSVMLRLLSERMEGAVHLDNVELPDDRPLVDCMDGPLDEVTCWLSMVGLSDAAAMLHRPCELSEGQRYRLRLALALAKKPKVICIDEFCNSLDRVAAAMVAWSIRKFADKYETTFLVASAHDDILEDLSPDVIVIKHLGGTCDVVYPCKLE
ncbi:MAG: ATP-binding cassette domain-containing protein [Sedimentisphaerales bacterium]|nr:ATP-binding cassette domain-containing protein [Sedimentisphaerales bacterium]